MRVSVVSCYPEEFEDKLNKKISEIESFPKENGNIIDIKFSIDESLSHSRMIALILWEKK
jgi:hypothetical protein